MSHNAFEMLILPLLIQTTMIFLAMAVAHTLFGLVLGLARRCLQPAWQVRPAIDGHRVPSVSPVAPASRAGAFRPAARSERSSRAQALHMAGTTMA
jgi:hypothetical protein